MHMPFRKDVQVLRGIAVLLVLLFHLGIDSFSGGFLGVDVFFVVSGYLMAVVYDPARKADFFAKRVRRLLPTYFAVILATLLAAIIVTSPIDFAWVFEQASYASVFASNIRYWMENSYFEKDTFKPLLHLWSLGVEIQFYLLVPVVYWLFLKAPRAFVFVAIASALLCFYVVGISPKTSFFLLPFRLWEFVLGFLVAKTAQAPSHAGRKTEWLGPFALAGTVGMAFFPVDGQSLGFASGHPGLAALLVTLLTASTLYFGIPERIVSRLPFAVLAKIGDYSYSIYLAHFPVIVFYHYRPFSGTVLKATHAGETVPLALLILLASLLLFHVVEQPLRKARSFQTRWLFGAAASVIVLGVAGMAVQKMLVPEREMLIYQAWYDRDDYRCGKLIRIIHPTTAVCAITQPISTPLHRVMLVGNSHADSIKAAFAEAAQAANVSVFFVVENRPLMPGGATTPESLMREAEARGIDAIVLHYSPDSLNLPMIQRVAALAAVRSMHVSLIMPVPVWDRPVPLMLLEGLKSGKPLTTLRNKYSESNRALILGLAASQPANLKVYATADAFCEAACKLMSDAGQPLYFDAGHLTLTGSRMLKPVFERLVADLSEPVLPPKGTP